MTYDVLVVGGGAAGLTAAAYAARAGRSVALFERQARLGGLVQSVERDGFVFDMGLRAIESAGIVLPMLEELGLSLEFVRSPVSVGIDDDLIRVDSKASLTDYRDLLVRTYPDRAADVDRIVALITRIMRDMDVLYGIDNPLFKDPMRDRRYLFRTLLAVDGALRRHHRAHQPDVGPGRGPARRAHGRPGAQADRRAALLQGDARLLRDELLQRLPRLPLPARRHGGADAGARGVRPRARRGRAHRAAGRRRRSRGAHRHRREGEVHGYGTLVWCADLKALYRAIDTDAVADAGLARAVVARRDELEACSGSDSVLSLFLSVDEPPATFEAISEGHLFYTPDARGLGDLHTKGLAELLARHPLREEALEAYLDAFFARTTYEVSIPVLKDPALAPPGKTGLIVSTLFDYRLTRRIQESGGYDAFRDRAADAMIAALARRLYPGLGDKVRSRFMTTPVTLEAYTGNTDGAIVGWAFDGPRMPAVHQMQRVAQSVRTPIPGVLQAGQWAYSPGGVPMAILTGKLAANRALKGGRRPA